MKNKILLFDLETSPNIAYSWNGKYEVNIIEFIEEKYIMSVAYKWLGEKGVHCFNLGQYKFNHKKFIAELHKLFNDAEVNIAHNGDSFDIKMANREFIKYGFQPPSPYKQIDTLKIARSKCKFNDNRLDALGEFLGLGRKKETGGFPLWKSCMRNEKDGWRLMTKYNKQDVVLLEQVYLKLRAWATTVPNFIEDGEICPCCGSKEKTMQGNKRMTNSFYKKRYQCSKCGRWWVGKTKFKIDELHR